ncbi:MAG: radical SAM protein [Deltaproteobacteria bacterium]|nr:radical SAM protein [Deltaproteobacteria bacterium]
MNIVFIDINALKNGGNIGLGYLSAVLLEKGHRVHVIGNDIGIDAINKRIAEKDADLIGFSIRSNDTRRIVQLANGIKRKKGSHLICGGPNITVNGFSFMQENPCFEMAISGEAEETILDVVEFLQGKKNLREIKGVIGRDAKGVFINEKRDFTKDLESLPIPDYRVFDIYEKDLRVYGIITSRGCPYNCTYCNGPTVSGKKLRYRSLDKVIEELVRAKRTYPALRWVDILDDNFTLNIKRAKEICQAMIDKKLNLQWRLPNGIRADKIDDELAALMKKAGCKLVKIGIESGSPEIFESINKGETLGHIEHGISFLRKNGMRVEGSFIIGLPLSSYEKDLESVRFAKKLNLHTATFHIFCPLKKTKAYEQAYEQKGVRVLKDEQETPIEYFSGKPYSVFDTVDYPEKDRIRAFMKGNLRFNHYLFTRDFSKSPFAIDRALLLAKIIIQYDPLYIPVHIVRLAKKFILAAGFRVKLALTRAKTDKLQLKEKNI